MVWYGMLWYGMVCMVWYYLNPFCFGLERVPIIATFEMLDYYYVV